METKSVDCKEVEEFLIDQSIFRRHHRRQEAARLPFPQIAIFAFEGEFSIHDNQDFLAFTVAAEICDGIVDRLNWLPSTVCSSP